MKKRFAVVVAALAGVYLFVPEPTDLIPVIGWLDEGLAGALLVWSLKILEVSPASIWAKVSPAGAKLPAPGAVG
jgi:hypothetical protein